MPSNGCGSWPWPSRRRSLAGPLELLAAVLANAHVPAVRVDQPQFAQLACETIVEIAHHREVRDPNKAEFDKALDKVIKTAKDPVVIDRAQRYQRGETWERPKRK